MYEPFFLLITAAVAVVVPNVVLGNSRGTAVPGLLLPAVGLGTGACKFITPNPIAPEKRANTTLTPNPNSTWTLTKTDSNNAAVGYNG